VNDNPRDKANTREVVRRGRTKPLETSGNVVDLDIRETIQLSAEDQAVVKGGFFTVLREKHITRSLYTKKLKAAATAELKNFNKQVEIRLKSAEQITQATFEEMVGQARLLRDGLMDNLTRSATAQYQTAFDDLLADYEAAFARCNPEDPSLPDEINAARRERIRQCTETYLGAVDGLATRLKAYLEDWSSGEAGRKILTLED